MYRECAPVATGADPLLLATAAAAGFLDRSCGLDDGLGLALAGTIAVATVHAAIAVAIAAVLAAVTAIATVFGACLGDNFAGRDGLDDGGGLGLALAGAGAITAVFATVLAAIAIAVAAVPVAIAAILSAVTTAGALGLGGVDRSGGHDSMLAHLAMGGLIHLAVGVGSHGGLAIACANHHRGVQDGLGRDRMHNHC